MDWLANILSKLPLEQISDAVSSIIIWWSQLVEGVPPDMLPLYAYVGFSVVVLLLWLFVVKVLPAPFGGMSWLAIFAVLLTPSTAVGGSSEIAPASIGVIYGILMKEPGLAMQNLLPILVVFAFGLVLGFIWQVIKGIVEKSIEKSRDHAEIDQEQEVKLAAANYSEIVDSDTTMHSSESAAQHSGKSIPKAKQRVQERIKAGSAKTTIDSKADKASDINKTDINN